jgi:hypothetical protein
VHGNFSRMRFDPLDRFSAVVALQGRVSVEADYNEHTSIQQHYLRTVLTDLVGEHAWPATAAGFSIAAVVDGGAVTDLSIAPGRCYVEGMLVENPAASTYSAQPDLPQAAPLPKSFPYFVYLEAFERLITSYEHPPIRDSALPAWVDSSARTKTVWQVRASDPVTGNAATVADAMALWQPVEATLLGTMPTLAVSLGTSTEDQLCALAPQSGFRGTGNQYYRCEWHEKGVKWSRDNGSVVFPVTGADKAVIDVAHLGHDDLDTLDLGEWVELVDDSTLLERQPLALRRVTAIDRVKLLVTLDAQPERPFGSAPELHPLLRRWDQQPLAKDMVATENTIDVSAGTFAMEDGIEATIAGTGGPGDYWVFAARVGAGIDWPTNAGTPVPRPPDGVRRWYVPLALVSGATQLLDLRTTPFGPLA